MNVGIKLAIFPIFLALSTYQLIGKDALFGLTLKVVDEEGRPVADASARIGAERRPVGDESSGKGVFAEGVTDPNGYFSGVVETWNASQAGYRVQKEGHYGVWLTYRSKSPINGKWQPWNPTVEVLLKQIKNPVPMYAKNVTAEVPVSHADVGYDLVEGDWVAPHGKGVAADMILHCDGEVQDDRNYRGTLTVSFPGAGNGLIPFEIAQPKISPLRMPYHAPEDGYGSTQTWRSVRRYNAQTRKNEEYIDDSSPTRNYFIRVRSELDANGKVLKAMYGKIHAPFIFDARGINPWGRTKKQYVAFTYYLNPDGTRNIEYDPTRNLFKPAKHDEPEFRSLAP